MARHSLAALSLVLAAIPVGLCAQEASLRAGGPLYLGTRQNVRAVSARVDRVTIYDDTGQPLAEIARSDLFAPEAQGLDILAINDGLVAVYYNKDIVWLKIGDLVIHGVGLSICGGQTHIQSLFSRSGYHVALDENKACLVGANQAATVDVPFLPWPAPRPTYLVDVTHGLKSGQTFDDVSAQLTSRLQSKGYDNLKFFSVPWWICDHDPR